MLMRRPMVPDLIGHALVVSGKDRFRDQRQTQGERAAALKGCDATLSEGALRATLSALVVGEQAQRI